MLVYFNVFYSRPLLVSTCSCDSLSSSSNRKFVPMTSPTSSNSSPSGRSSPTQTITSPSTSSRPPFSEMPTTPTNSAHLKTIIPENAAAELYELIQNLTKIGNEKGETAIRLRSLRCTIKRNQAVFKAKLKDYETYTFEDRDFKTNRSSLYLTTDTPDPMYDKLIATWVRIKDINFDELQKDASRNETSRRWRFGLNFNKHHSSNNFTVRESSSSVQDFRQGRIGNCWFLAGLASLVWHHSHQLTRIIPDPHINAQGIYQLFFCFEGNWDSIEIDDYFPVDQKNRLVFAQALSKQLYAPLMEKALAKYHSCYKALSVGTVLEGFSTLTGMPLTRKTLKNSKITTLWEEMRECLRNRYMVAACCSRTVHGLFEDHAYSVLDAKISGDVRALLMWNPWNQLGRQELTDVLLEAHQWLQSRLPKVKLCPGMFWLRFADFALTFEYVDICKFNSKWNCKRFEFMMPFDIDDRKNFTIFDVDLTTTTHLEFTVYQEIHRDTKFKYTLELSVLIFRRLQDNSLQLAGSSPVFVTKVFSYGRSFPAGQYLVSVVSFNHWGPTSRLKESPRMSLAFHGSKKYTVTPLACDMNVLGDMIIEWALNIGTVRQNGQNWTEYVVSGNCCSYITLIENCNANQHLIVSSNTESSHNVFSLRSQRNTIDLVPPNSRQIIVIQSRECDKLTKIKYYSVSEVHLEQKQTKHDGQHDFSSLKVHPDVKKMSVLFAPRRIDPEKLVEIMRKQMQQNFEKDEESGISFDNMGSHSSTKSHSSRKHKNKGCYCCLLC